MFDVGFSEIVVIGVVALIVIGPERLPKAARTLGLLFGRLQRYVGDVKADINREMELDELRKLQQQVQGAAQELKSSVETAAHDVQQGVRGVEEQLNATAADGVSPAIPAGDATVPGSAPALAPASTDLPADSSRQPSLPGFDKI